MVRCCGFPDVLFSLAVVSLLKNRGILAVANSKRPMHFGGKTFTLRCVSVTNHPLRDVNLVKSNEG